ncbi:MAG TPA: hypothetical protein VHY58_21735 [Streptosporangiaceae bacterium]|jgi:hypothetical protein|nr:hypothetical protein [Streptosporangiaceae bacterium]
MSQKEPIPVACTLGAGDLADRVTRWRAVAARAAGERSPTEHGVRLSFATGPGVAAELRELAALERDCCAFATWSVRQDGDRVLVEVSGDSPEAAQAVQVMFDELAGAGS